MTIKTYITPYLSSHMYMIAENGHCIIIDPCEMDELKRDLSGFTVDYVLLTHEHDDHITGVEWSKKELGAPVLCSKACAVNIKDPRANHSYYFNLMKSLMSDLVKDMSVSLMPFSCTATDTFEDEMSISWQGHSLYLRETPGHSRGGACILLDGKHLFTGDSLMLAQTATCFKGGSLDMYNELTLPWLYSLDSTISVYPGHYEPFLLGERLKDEHYYQEGMRHHG